MAYDWTGAAAYSGRTGFQLRLYVRRNVTDIPNNRATYAWELYCQRVGGHSSTWNGTPARWDVNIGGWAWNGMAALDMRGKNKLTLASGVTGWIYHDANGYLNLYSSASHGNFSNFGTAAFYSGIFYTDRIPRTPSAPTMLGAPNPDQITTDSMRVRFSGNNNGGSAIIRWELQYSPHSNFTGATTITSSGTSVVTGLSPGTRYYFRARGVNAIGNGAWSGSVNAETIAAEAPGLTVTPSASGTSATTTMVPPPGSIVNYTIERRVTGTTTPVTSVDVTELVRLHTGLEPGTSYQWRARANYSSSSSPWTSWVTAVQPSPNVEAGRFFDGSSTGTDVTYAWTGTANNSTSTATGKRPEGWWVDVDGPGDAVIQRVTGGRFGSYSARVVVLRDTTSISAGMQQGSGFYAEVQPGSPYVGSVFIRSAQALTVVPEMIFYTAGGSVLDTVAGQPVTLSGDGTTWTRLVVSGNSPASAIRGVMRARIDSATSGMEFFLDGAMLSLTPLVDYFDGSTADTPEYNFSWLGTAHQSVSQRLQVPGGQTIDPLRDPDCAVVPKPPRPPAVPDLCIEETGIWRRYWVFVPDSAVADWIDSVPTVSLLTHGQEERQVRIRYFPNPDGLQPDEIAPDSWEWEQIVSYIPANTLMTLDGTTQQAWAEVGNGEPLTANHLLYGTGGTPADWPVLACGSSYWVAFDVPTANPAGNLDPALALTERY